MEYSKLLSHLTNHFKVDPLFRKIHTDNLEHLLFNNGVFYQRLTLEPTYSSKQAAELLEIEGKEQSLLNYINRNNIGEYLNVLRQNRFYRYDWESLFKFKMIFLLNDHGYGPMDIASIVGTNIPTSSTESNDFNSSSTQTNTLLSKDDVEDIIDERTDAKLGSIQVLILEERKLVLIEKIEKYEQEIADAKQRKLESETYVRFISDTRINNEEPLGILAKIFSKKTKSDTKEDLLTRTLKDYTEKIILNCDDIISGRTETLKVVHKDLLSINNKIEEIAKPTLRTGEYKTEVKTKEVIEHENNRKYISSD